MKKTTKKKMQSGGMYGAAPARPADGKFQPKLNPSAAMALKNRQEYQSNLGKQGINDRDQVRSMMKTYDTQNNTPTGMRYQKGGKIKGGGGARAKSIPGMGMTKIKKKLAGVRDSIKPKKQRGGKVNLGDYDVAKAYTESKNKPSIPPKPGGLIFGPKSKQVKNFSERRFKKATKNVEKWKKQDGGKAGDIDMIQKYKDMTKKPISPGRGGYIPGKPAKGNGIKNFDKAKNLREQYERMVNRPAKGPKTPKRYK